MGWNSQSAWPHASHIITEQETVEDTKSRGTGKVPGQVKRGSGALAVERGSDNGALLTYSHGFVAEVTPGDRRAYHMSELWLDFPRPARDTD